VTITTSCDSSARRRVAGLVCGALLLHLRP